MFDENITLVSKKTGEEFEGKVVKVNKRTILVEVEDKKNGGTKIIKRRKK